jgi:two-component system sensor histidine kinase RpfC
MSVAAPAEASASAQSSQQNAGGLWARLRARPDSEHELTFNRLALSGLVLVYLATASWFGNDGAQEMLRATGVLFALYWVTSALFFVDIIARPQASPVRRGIGIFVDLGMFSYAMYAGGEATAPFFPIYLWVIFGNGFRFGVPYLAAAVVVGIAMFGAVVLTTPYWQAHQSLALGLLAGLIVLPAYAATLIRKLNAAKRQAEAASRAKSMFLASVSHELRTPLNAVIGLSDLMRDTGLDAEQRDMVETIGHSGRSLLTLINSILDLSRIEAGRMPTSSTPFDLMPLLGRIR